jgi:hypothetical protein
MIVGVATIIGGTVVVLSAGIAVRARLSAPIARPARQGA